MVEPVKPFACSVEDCGMTFTNEDHLHVHTKKHDMVLQLGLEQKTAFVADQTPTPTRFIRNCEEVGLFQDLQNVNPFDEGFKRAMETKAGILSLDNAIATTTSDDVLHTPQMVFPNLSDGSDTSLYSSHNQRNIIISRSSSDESGVIREYETTTISKLTNEVTTKHTSRVVSEKIITTDDVAIVRHQELAQNILNKDSNETSVSYKNNIIKIHSNIEISQNVNQPNAESRKNVPILISYTGPTKDSEIATKDILLTDSNKLSVPDNTPKGPIMSQKSLDYVVDSFTSVASPTTNADKDIHLIDVQRVAHPKPIIKASNNFKCNGTRTKSIIKHKRKPIAKRKLSEENKTTTKMKINENGNNYEAIIKLPDGKSIRLKSVEGPDFDTKASAVNKTKEQIKNNLLNKVSRKVESLPVIQNVIANVPTANLIPVTLVQSVNAPILLSQHKIPIPALPASKSRIRVKSEESLQNNVIAEPKISKAIRKNGTNSLVNPGKIVSISSSERRNAASKRYRDKLKEKWDNVNIENKKLIDFNNRLMEENTRLKEMLLNHTKTCSNWDDLRLVNSRCHQNNSNKSSLSNQQEVPQATPSVSPVTTDENISTIAIIGQ